jgi:hypothetical protein
MRESRKERKAGAAMVESCLAVIMLCLILFGILQVSYLIMARDVITFSAFASARALTVGMKEDFIERVARTASIPTAGPIITPSSLVDFAGLADDTQGAMWDRALGEGPQSDQFWVEHYLIPFYLGANDDANLNGILNYLNWRNSDTKVSVESSEPGDDEAEVTVKQYVPLAFPFARVFFRENMGQIIRRNEAGGYEYREVPLYLIEQTVKLENHSALYLTNQ